MIKERRRSIVLLAGATLAAGVLTAGFAGPANAGLRPVATSHCVSAAVPAGSTITAAPVRCFNTFTDAISFATDGAVRLPAGATAVTQQQLDAGRAAGTLGYEQPMLASVVLGISYANTGWSGSTWVHTGSFGCDTNADVDWQNSGPFGATWDNAIGSATSYGDCQGEYFAGTSFTGASIWTGWSGGVMNNATSSIQWS